MSDLQKTADEQLASPSRRRAFFWRFSPEPEPVVPDSRYPRPPWAVKNKLFLPLCSQCDQCLIQVKQPKDVFEQGKWLKSLVSGTQ